jgi:hypothetical protein
MSAAEVHEDFLSIVAQQDELEDPHRKIFELRRQLRGRGYRPVAVYGPDAPVGNPGKQPKGRDWLEGARLDPPQAIDNWPEDDALNTGILCEGLVVIDVDVDDDAAAETVVEATISLLGHAPLRFREGSPRVALLYRADNWEPAPRTAKGAAGKVEILGSNQQLVAYGVHRSGAKLCWKDKGPADISVEDLPSATEDQIASVIDHLQVLLGSDTGPAVPRRHEHAGSVCGQTADSFELIAALNAIPNDGLPDWDWWNRIGMAMFAATAGSDLGFAAWDEWSNRNPYYDHDHCRERWANYRRSQPTEIGAGTIFHLARVAKPGWHKGSHWSPAQLDPLPPLRVVSAPELLSMDLSPRKLVFDPWLPEKGLAMVYGPRGIGKTHFILGTAHAIATGGSFLKWKAPTPGRIMIIDGEMPTAALRERLMSYGEMPDTLAFLAADMQERDFNLSNEAHQRDLQPLLEGIDVIIVDNIATLTSNGRENEVESWRPVQKWAIQQRREGRSVVFVHHAGKSGQQRGTSGHEDVLDTVISLRRPGDYHPKQGARFELHFEKARSFQGNDAIPFEAMLGANLQWSFKSLSDVTMDRVVELTKEDYAIREIADELGISKSTVQRVQDRARKLGKLPTSVGDEGTQSPTVAEAPE